MRKIGLIAGSAIVAVAAIGISIGWLVKHRRKPGPVRPAAIAAVFEGAEVTLTGAIQPQSTEQIAAPIAGILDAWFVDIGAEVYEDQLVGRIQERYGISKDEAQKQADAWADAQHEQQQYEESTHAAKR